MLVEKIRRIVKVYKPSPVWIVLLRDVFDDDGKTVTREIRAAPSKLLHTRFIYFGRIQFLSENKQTKRISKTQQGVEKR